MKWIAIAGAGLVAALVLTRRWSPITRMAADSEFGRRHYLMVKFWRVWLLCMAAAAVLVAVAVATAPGKTSAGGDRAGTPAASPSTAAPGDAHAAAATPVPTVPVAAGGDTRAGVPPLAIAAVCLLAAGGLLAVSAASRARGRREVDEFVALHGEYGDIGEDGAAGTADETEDDDDDDDDDDAGEGGEVFDGDELVDSGAGGTVHDLSRRRRRVERRGW
jgi:hypothetical protein